MVVMKVLVIEDEKSIAEAIQAILENAGYEADLAFDGEYGLDCILTGIYDVILLDLMLPKLDGISVLKRSRHMGNDTPIICLTAKSQLDDKVLGLDQGANDYITKPFEAEELLARIRVQSRQSTTVQANHLQMGNLLLDLDSRELKSPTRHISLSNKEFLLLETFLRNPNQILSKDQLIVKVWGPLNEAEYNQLEVFVTFLRKKLRFLEANLEIKATRGAGYSIREVSS